MSVGAHSRRFADAPITSGLPPLTDIGGIGRHVSNVPILLKNSAVEAQGVG
jgi:hypothetical protein